MHDAPASLLACGARAPLVITDRGVSSYYWLGRIDGGWELLELRDDGDAQQHVVACFDRGDVSTWECSCRGGSGGSGRRCVHVAALAALLRRAGL